MDLQEILTYIEARIRYLECDGASRVLNYLLTQNKIPHKVYVGTLGKENDGRIPMHWWIELENGFLLDYKAQMWYGKNAPNGMFKKEDYPKYLYQGKQKKLHTPEILYKILISED